MGWIVRTNDFKQNDLTGEVMVNSRHDALMRGLKRLGLFWLVALFSVLVPLMHFVLTPAFLAVGVYSLWLQLKNTHSVRDGSYVCGACQQQVPLKNFYFTEGQRFQCSHCQTQLVVEQGEQKA